MKRFYALAMMFCLSIFLIVAANAATEKDKSVTAEKKAVTEVGASDTTGTPQGLMNLKKAMSHRIERSKKMHEKIDGQGSKKAGQ